MTAVLIGFCQELGIRNVLTTEVIDWARGAVHEAVLAAQLMHFAHARGTPPKHIDGRLLTVKDEEFRPYAEAELRELHAQVTDPNFRIFADADWIYVFNADRFVKGTDFNEIFDQLGVDEATHAFYLGKELMKATIARALRKNYRQESPLDWGYMTFAEPRRERVRLTAQRTQTRRRGGNVKKILIQLDTDEHPSTFDAIVAHDAGVDELLRYGGIEPDAVQGPRAVGVLHPRPEGPGHAGGVGRRLERGRRRGGAGRGRGGVLRPVPGVGDARLQRLQHDRGDDGRAARRARST